MFTYCSFHSVCINSCDIAIAHLRVLCVEMYCTRVLVTNGSFVCQHKLWMNEWTEAVHSLKGIESAPLHEWRKVSFWELVFELINKELRKGLFTNDFVPKHWRTMGIEAFRKTGLNPLNENPMFSYRAKWEMVRRNTHNTVLF